MSSILVHLINKAKLNPIATTAFGLAMTSLTFWFNYEINYAETKEKLERNYIEISSLNKELSQTDSLIKMWRTALIRNDSLVHSIEFINNPSYHLNKDDISELVVIMTKTRTSFDDIIIQTSSQRIENKTLSNILLDINTDATFVDSYIKERINFIVLVFKDKGKAESIKNQYKSTVEGYRRFAEINARLQAINHSYDKVVDLHNSLVRIDKEERSRSTFKSKILIACWSYIAGYLGYWLGFIIRRYLKEKKTAKEPNVS